MPNPEEEPTRSYKKYAEVGEPLWLKQEFVALTLDFLWPTDGVGESVQYPLAVTHEEIRDLVYDIGFGPYFTPPGHMLGSPEPTLYHDAAEGPPLPGFDYERTFTVGRDMAEAVLEVGRDTADQLYMCLTAHYQRGAWTAFQSFGYFLDQDKAIQACMATHIACRGRTRFEEAEQIGVGDSSGPLALVNRGRAIYNALGTSTSTQNDT